MLDQPNIVETFSQIIKIDLNHDSRMGFDVAKVIGEHKEEKWHMFKCDVISRNINLFTSMVLIHTSFFVSHANYVLIYNLIEKKWKSII